MDVNVPLVQRIIDTRIKSGCRKMVFMAIAALSDDEGVLTAPISEIADIAGCTIRSVQNAVKTLEGDGLLKVQRALGRFPNSYQVDVFHLADARQGASL